LNKIERKILWNKDNNKDLLLTKEWLQTNGLGGYSSGTLAGVPTRRYHGLLIATLPAPLGRYLIFNHLTEVMKFNDGKYVQIGAEERSPQDSNLQGADYLTEFRLDHGIPIWTFSVNNNIIEKTIILTHNQNTVHIKYKLVDGNDSIRIELRPSIHFRPHEEQINISGEDKYILKAQDNRYEIYTESLKTNLRLMIFGENAALTSDGGHKQEVYYRAEQERGYNPIDHLWSPGYLRAEIKLGKDVILAASTEPWEKFTAINPSEAFNVEFDRRLELLNFAPEQIRSGIPSELLFAADQFVFTPASRTEDAIRISAEGGDFKSVIAGYHWFTDWGRDTMISLEGLTIQTGRLREAYWILRTFAHYVKNGLIPNLFPEGEKEGLYHTADATLWFFHAINRYQQATNDNEILVLLLPTLLDIIDHHMKGTIFGIGIDHDDGLMKQGADGYQLTWMDAKVDGWVVTPRRGKAVELNALWFNALMLTSQWLREKGDIAKSEQLLNEADKACASFNRRFWYEEGGYLYDVVDGESGDDNTFRPNQIFSFSLSYPILQRDKWERVLTNVKERLLTPVGLRTLAPGHPDYKPKYYGNLKARDSAYHQGTVWAWLLGPFIDAWLRVYPDDIKTARSFLDGLVKHLDDACIGSVSEIFDGEEPFSPRGCIAQAWSVAEFLRCWIKTS